LKDSRVLADFARLIQVVDFMSYSRVYY